MLLSRYERGVLTVQPSRCDWFNAILVSGYESDALAALDQRERGYTRVSVPMTQLEPYHEAGRFDEKSEVWLYAGREDKWNDALLPNRAYLRICTDAAEQQGTRFARDFLRTTRVGDLTLEEFLA